MDNVRCPSYVYSMSRCHNDGVGNVSATCYGHNGDVGVVCTDSELGKHQEKSLYFVSECIIVCMCVCVSNVWYVFTPVA